MHWLEENSPKSIKYRFIMFVLGLLQSTDCKRPKTRCKNYFEATLSNLKASFKKEPRSTIEQKKLRLGFIFDSGCTGWQSTPLNQVNINLSNLVGGTRDPKERAIIILKLLYVTRKRVLIKNQRALSNRGNERNCC